MLGRGLSSVEVGRGEVVHGMGDCGKLGRRKLGHGLMAWILTRWVTGSWQR